MLSNYGYGLTDNSPNTPWNEPSIPDRDFDVEVSVTLSKFTTVTTNDYRPYRDDEDGSVYYDTGDVDWVEDYDSQHLDIIELLSELRKLATEKLNTDISVQEKKHLKKIIEESEGWETIEKYVSKE